MKYSEWAARLKDQTKSLPDEMGGKINAYYANLYADRRAAGFSDEEILRLFGTPAEAAAAAQDILFAGKNAAEKRKLIINSVLFSFLCVVISLPILALMLVMGAVTVVLAALPFALIIAGGGFIVSGVAVFTGGAAGISIASAGIGLAVAGVGIALIRIMFIIIRQMWKLFGAFIAALAGLYRGGANEKRA